MRRSDSGGSILARASVRIASEHPLRIVSVVRTAQGEAEVGSGDVISQINEDFCAL